MVRALQGEKELLKCLVSRLSHASEFSLGMALVSAGGLAIVGKALESCLARGGRGRFLFGVDLPTDPKAIEVLQAIRKKHPDSFDLRRFQQGRRPFHAKMSIFVSGSKRSAIIGSSNLTEGGLRDNHESNLLVEERAAVDSLGLYFEEHFLGAHAQPVDEAWLAEYRQHWKRRKAILKREEHLRATAAAHAKPAVAAPRRIAGHRIAFTGKIENWPRDRKLYPEVRRQHGEVVLSADEIGSADYLVHGEILGGRKTFPIKLIQRPATVEKAQKLGAAEALYTPQQDSGSMAVVHRI